MLAVNGSEKLLYFVMGLGDTMGALTDQRRTSTKSPSLSPYSFSNNRSKSKSRLFSQRLETEERSGYKRSATALSIPNQISWSPEKKQRLVSPPFHRSHQSLLLPPPEPSIKAANLINPQWPSFPVTVIRTLESFPPPSPLTRAVQGPQRPQQHSRMFSASKQLGKRVSEVQHLVDESRVWSKLEDQWNNMPGCCEESSNPKALEDYKRRVAVLQRTFNYSQINDNDANGVFTRQRGLEINSFSSPTITAHVDAERSTEARPGHDREAKAGNGNDDREAKAGDGNEAKAGNSQPPYKELYEKAQVRDFKLKCLALEVELTAAKFAALKFTSNELFKNKEKEAEVAEQKSLIQQALEDAFAPLNDDEEADVSRALNGRDRREVLVMHENSNIEITREKLRCLVPGGWLNDEVSGWLNDEVINLYLELLKEREKREPDRFLKCHFFNTFFYKKLYNPNTRYDYKAVRRWTTQRKIGYSLIDCEKIFVPIHKEIHWCLAVIDMKAKKFQYLDSLGGSDACALEVLARYISDEAKDKTGKDIDVSSWETELVDDLPRQENGSDCGMFMIKYADFYSRGLSLSFFQTHMPYFRKRTAKEILRLKAE